MPCLHNYDAKDQKYIFDAIMNGEYKINNSKYYALGPIFLWDPIYKLYRYSNTFPEKINKKHTKTFEPKTFMNRGDVICFGGVYRNDRKMIFNGEKLEDLYTKIDDYGSVPPNYEVCDDGFNIGDFEELIEHNSINWLSKKKLKEIKIFELDNKVVGSVTIKNKLWYIDIYIHQEFKDSTFLSAITDLKFTFNDNQILLVDTSNKNDIYKNHYLLKFKNEGEISNYIENNNLSFIDHNNEWYVYKINKEYTYNELEPSFPCILVQIEPSIILEFLILDKEAYDAQMKIDFIKKKIKSYIVREVTCSLVTIEIVKKNNEILMQDITNFINEKIDNYDNINDRIPFSKSAENELELLFY